MQRVLSAVDNASGLGERLPEALRHPALDCLPWQQWNVDPHVLPHCVYPVGEDPAHYPRYTAKHSARSNWSRFNFSFIMVINIQSIMCILEFAL